MKQIRLTKQWNSVPQGRTFEVLQPGEDLRKGAVDANRAATLVAKGFAVDPDAPKPAADKKTPPKDEE